MELGFETYTKDEFGKETEFFKTNQTVMVRPRNCISGEEHNDQGYCIKCLPGFYLLKPALNQTSCLKCKPNAYCAGGSFLFPDDGFQRSDNMSDIIMSCYNPDHCLEGNETSPTGNCGVGYKGFLCGTCKDNFVKGLLERCESCWHWLISIVVFLL